MAVIAVGKLLDFLRREKNILGHIINNHEVIAETVHFRKVYQHPGPVYLSVADYFYLVPGVVMSEKVMWYSSQ